MTNALTVLILAAIGAPLGCSSSEARPSEEEIASTSSPLVTIASRITTPSLPNYHHAPRTPDSDDPAIWVNPRRQGDALVIGALKDAGLQAYDLAGHVLQTVSPPKRPAITESDPAAPGVQPEAATGPCEGSASGKTFGRFNNLDVQYGFELRDPRGRTRKVDIVVVSDRGCDRLRIYAIEPGRRGGPLVDVTSADVPRVFPERFAFPSDAQPSGETHGLHANPIDDQSTAYGLALYRAPRAHGHGGARSSATIRAFVTQRSRSVVAELELVATADGRVSYRRVRELRFDPTFRLPKGDAPGSITWTPCREDAQDDPQLEGLVIDQELGVLYAAQEVVGIWKIPLASLDDSRDVVDVDPSLLLEPVKSFAAPYWAVPDGDEYACTRTDPRDAAGDLPVGTVAVAGNAAFSGSRIEADVEGLAIYYGEGSRGYVVASSQGDDTFHVFERAAANRYIGGFHIDGVGATDGHDIVNVSAGGGFHRGMMVVQNGKAPAPPSQSPVGGYDYDGSSRFELVDWRDIATSFQPPLVIDSESYDPRAAR